ncbi:hypothetical protein ATL42_0210 [Sanguibacter antarcticus]|uniref:Uncharacterized protein n=1 Tax=Sanguibacter antarcticus TaxID=372484 RepID=A0A2A9E0L8_9MICO|nr:hypothetical protein ATL42_0210 [Sanguibacter antarcticus]
MLWVMTLATQRPLSANYRSRMGPNSPSMNGHSRTTDSGRCVANVMTHNT